VEGHSNFMSHDFVSPGENDPTINFNLSVCVFRAYSSVGSATDF
jgi:hypothetical protein